MRQYRLLLFKPSYSDSPLVSTWTDRNAAFSLVLFPIKSLEVARWYFLFGPVNRDGRF